MKVRIGIMSEQLVRARVLAIAQGEYTPTPDEPNVWYTSFNAVAQILNPENIALLRLIDAQQPDSITALAALSGRKKSNLSNTLKSLSEKGFLRLDKGQGRTLKPIALFTDFEIVTNKALEDKLTALQAA